jgi:hypothetical protein
MLMLATCVNSEVLKNTDKAFDLYRYFIFSSSFYKKEKEKSRILK